MKKFSIILGVALVASFASAGVAGAVEPATHQDFEAKVFAGSKPGNVPGKGSIGSYLKPFHNETWPAPGVPKPVEGPNGVNLNAGALDVAQPFATIIAYVYLDKNVTFNADKFPGCSEKKMLALAPEKNFAGCPKGSQLGAGEAAGFARPLNAPPGRVTRTTTIVTRVFATGKKNKITLFTYNELIKGNLIDGYLEKATPAEQALGYGSKIKFVLRRGLIAPTPTLVSQLSAFDATIPAQSYKGKPLMTLKKCPADKQVRVGYQGLYSTNAKAKPGVNPKTGNDFVETSKSTIIAKTGACK